VEQRFWKPQVETAFEQARAQVGAPPLLVETTSPPAPKPAADPPPPPAPAPRPLAPATLPKAAPPPPPHEDDNAPVVGIRARAMAGAEAGRPLPIQARIGADVGTPARVMLFYRTTGGSKFSELVMAPNGEAFKAAIPGAEVRLPALQYYVEARDSKNRPLARR